MFNPLLKNEMQALNTARRQLTLSHRALGQAQENLMKTTETCLVQPATLVGIFAGGVASEVLTGSSEKDNQSGLLSTLKLSFLAQMLHAFVDAHEVKSAGTDEQ